MRKHPRFAAGAAAVLAGTGIGVLFPAPTAAWPPPTITTTGGACTGETGTDATPRTLIQWTITNRETAFPRSPATVTAVKVTDNLPTSWSTPIVLPNTGTATAKAQTYVPPSYSGLVRLYVEITFDGLDGTHGPLGAEATVNVAACPQVPPPPPPAPTTTTTTTVPSTTTTSSTTTTTSTTVVVVQAAEVVDPAPPAEPVRAAPRVTG